MPAIRFLACFALVFHAAAAQAQPAVLVNVDESNPPFMFASDGRARGVYPGLMAAAFDQMNVVVAIQPKPWLRVLAEIDAGTAGVGGIYKNSERLKRFDFSDALFVERVNIYSQRRDDARYASLADLKGKRVGVIRGWSYGDAFDSARRSGAMRVDDVGSDTQNFAKLEAGRLDVVLAIAEAAEPQLTKHPAVRLAGTLIENPTYLAFNKSAGMLPFIERFNLALAKLKQSGDAKKIVNDALRQR
jgi:polar amino acid transport system substrate-binding protein